MERTKPIDDTIHRNRLKLFVGSRTKTASKQKQQLTLMKNDVELFSRLYITCQTRDGNLEDFFQQENQAWPPALSDGGRLRLGTKSDILTCLDDLSPSQTKTHDATCIVLDGAAIKQMMKPAPRNLMNIPSRSSSHIVFLSCAVCHVWTLFGILTRMIP